MRLNWTASKGGFASAFLLGGLLLVGGRAVAQAGPQDSQIQADETKALDKKELRGVTANTQSGVVTLTGTVATFRDKQEAGKRATKVHGIASVNNQIQVSGGPAVSDEELGKKIAGKLLINDRAPDRTAFQIVNPSIQNGVVTLTGLVTDPVDKTDAEGIVADMPGVKDIVDRIEVAPLSGNDWRVRRDVFHAIYGYSTFTKYGINPVKPIRILVVNGNVTLVGAVDSESDKEQATIRANGVGGVFKVTNDLQVSGQRE